MSEYKHTGVATIEPAGIEITFVWSWAWDGNEHIVDVDDIRVGRERYSYRTAPAWLKEACARSVKAEESMNAFLVNDGRGTYEVHQKDAEGYELTIAGPGLSEVEALRVINEQEREV